MNDLKGLAEVADRLIYEALGVLLPGAALVLVQTAVLFPESWSAILAFGSAHPWITAGGCYAAGYVVQSLSRPVCNVTRWVVRLGPRAVLGIVSLVSPNARIWLATKAKATAQWLRSGHRPPSASPTEQCANLEDLVHDHWCARLGLPEGRRLLRRDVHDLAFSTLGDERGRLLRFRAVTSLCRGLAAIVALCAWALVTMLVGPWPLTGLAALCASLLVLVFWALSERADMYDGLWNAIIFPQFLAISTGAVPARPRGDLATTVGSDQKPPVADGSDERGTRRAADLLLTQTNPVVLPIPGDLLNCGAGRTERNSL